MAVHSKIEVSDDEFTPLSKAEPYIGRIQQNRGCQMMSLHPLAKLSPILAAKSKIEVSDDEFTPLSKAELMLPVYNKIEASDDEFTPLSKAEPYIGRIQQITAK